MTARPFVVACRAALATVRRLWASGDGWVPYWALAIPLVALGGASGAPMVLRSGIGAVVGFFIANILELLDAPGFLNAACNRTIYGIRGGKVTADAGRRLT